MHSDKKTVLYPRQQADASARQGALHAEPVRHADRVGGALIVQVAVNLVQISVHVGNAGRQHLVQLHRNGCLIRVGGRASEMKIGTQM